jgi:hypothetical protein
MCVWFGLDVGEPPVAHKIGDKVRQWFTLPQPEKRKRKTNLAAWAEDEILEAASEALNYHPISACELIDGIRLLGKLSDMGITPQDLDGDSLPDYEFYERLKQAVREED